jgi:deoxyribodipyrimidine photolyase-related protein
LAIQQAVIEWPSEKDRDREKAGTTLRLILGDQLNSQHSWFRRVREDVLYTLMEVRQETDAVRLHIQKVAGFFSAMRHFSAELIRNGHRVAYLRLDDPHNAQSFDANLNRLIREEGVTRFEYMQPDDYHLDRQLARLASRTCPFRRLWRIRSIF